MYGTWGQWNPTLLRRYLLHLCIAGGDKESVIYAIIGGVCSSYLWDLGFITARKIAWRPKEKKAALLLFGINQITFTRMKNPRPCLKIQTFSCFKCDAELRPLYHLQSKRNENLQRCWKISPPVFRLMQKASTSISLFSFFSVILKKVGPPLTRGHFCSH